MLRSSSGAPQLTQKCPTIGRLDRFRFRLGRVRLRSRSLHIGDADLVAPTLLGGIQRLVGAVDELREQSRLTGRGHADADRELQAAWNSCAWRMAIAACEATPLSRSA